MNTCILIAGLPASGKTTFAVHLGKELGLPMLSKDRIKELLYDTVGFRTAEEKVTLSIAGTSLLYYYAESLMCTGAAFILENNFENVLKPQLLQLLDQYRYRSITVRFGGEMDVIYQRYLQREESQARHPGHKTGLAYPPAEGDEKILSHKMSLEEFKAGVISRGIHDFSIGGDEISVDTTHFESVHYAEIVHEVKCKLGGSLAPP